MKFAQVYEITLTLPGQMCWLKMEIINIFVNLSFRLKETEISSSFGLMFNSLIQN